MSKYLISFIIITIFICFFEICMLAYLLIDIKTSSNTWLNSSHHILLFTISTIIIIMFHIFWIYTFFSTLIRYHNYLKLNDSLVSISLCSMAFSIIFLIFIIIFNSNFYLTKLEIIIMIILVVNISIMAMFNIFILSNYHNFNHRFIKNILSNAQVDLNKKLKQ